MKYLRSLRIVIALLFFIPVILYFVDFSGKLPSSLHELLRLQWIPALLSINVVVLFVLLLFSLLFGRLYCSTLCPLGVLQDIIAWKTRLFRKKKKKYTSRYKKPQNWVRYSILVASVLIFAAGSNVLILLLDPYSIFGRMSSQLFRPLVIWGNNGLAYALNNAGNYSLYKTDQAIFVPLIFGVSVFFFGLITWLSVTRGRLYCNLICPVGSFLGLLSRFSLFRVSIEESSCTHCGICAKHCKSECIDTKNKRVDDSRCVTCFDCIPSCNNNAIRYDFRYRKTSKTNTPLFKEPDVTGRRTFLLVSGALLATAVLARPKRLLLQNDPILHRKPVMPPGAGNIDHFSAHCTACQLCVAKCPMQVLKPATLEYGLTGIMQPHLTFSTEVFCTYDCNICTTVCPTNALRKLPVETKKLTQIGVAKFRRDLCVVYTDETDCGACSEHCPTQAVHMVPYKNGLTIPEVHDDICIGCGGCESICPAKPHQAIYVEGIDVQRAAKKPAEAKKFDKKIDDFGF